MNPGAPALEASTLPLGYRGGGAIVLTFLKLSYTNFSACLLYWQFLRQKDIRIEGVLCIFKEVIKVSKVHLPDMARSLEDPRVHVHIGDGVQYMKDHQNCFDVIITDAPDPIGQYS